MRLGCTHATRGVTRFAPRRAEGSGSVHHSPGGLFRFEGRVKSRMLLVPVR